MFVNGRKLLTTLLLLLLIFGSRQVWAASSSEEVPTTGGPTSGGPTSVGLIYFRASSAANSSQVLLEWETATEVGTAGFEIERRSGTSGPFVLLEEIGFVQSEGQPAIGAWYQEVDNTAVLGQTYTYRLWEIEYNNNRIALEVATITVGATPTPTPSLTATSAPATPTPTATNLPGSGSTLPDTPTATAVSPTQMATATTTATSAAATTPAGNTRPTATPTNATTSLSVPSPTATLAGSNPGSTTNTTVLPGPTATASSGSPPNTTGRQSLAEAAPTAAATTPLALAQADPDAAYPGQEPEASDSTGPEPVPPPTGAAAERESQLPSVGGGLRPDNQPPLPAAGQQPGTPVANLFLLWTGFILALLIFVVSVIGSIYLFTRQRD